MNVTHIYVMCNIQKYLYKLTGKIVHFMVSLLNLWHTTNFFCHFFNIVYQPIWLNKYLVMQSKKNMLFFLIKKRFFFLNIVQKTLVFYYYLQFKGRKMFFNTLECLFMLYTSCKTLHSVCQLYFHWFSDKLLNELQYKSP